MIFLGWELSVRYENWNVSRYTAIVGHDLSPAQPRMAEIKDISSPFIATICAVPRKLWEEGFLPIILRWLRNEQVPPTTYTEGALVAQKIMWANSACEPACCNEPSYLAGAGAFNFCEISNSFCAPAASPSFTSAWPSR